MRHALLEGVGLFTALVQRVEAPDSNVSCEKFQILSSMSISLCSRLFIPFNSHLQINWESLPKSVEITQVILRIRISLNSGHSCPFYCLLLIH